MDTECSQYEYYETHTHVQAYMLSSGMEFDALDASEKKLPHMCIFTFTCELSVCAELGDGGGNMYAILPDGCARQYSVYAPIGSGFKWRTVNSTRHTRKLHTTKVLVCASIAFPQHNHSSWPNLGYEYRIPELLRLRIHITMSE